MIRFIVLFVIGEGLATVAVYAFMTRVWLPFLDRKDIADSPVRGRHWHELRDWDDRYQAAINAANNVGRLSNTEPPTEVVP